VLGEPAREFDVLEPAGDFAHGVAEDLAVLGRQPTGDFLGVSFDEIPKPEHELGPTGNADLAPFAVRRLRRGDRRIDLFDACERDLAGLQAARGVEDGGGAPRVSLVRLASDDVRNPGDGVRGLRDRLDDSLHAIAPSDRIAVDNLTPPFRSLDRDSIPEAGDTAQRNAKSGAAIWI
jgi:hypothetical protein